MDEHRERTASGSKNETSHAEETLLIRRVAWYAFLINLFLAALKTALAAMSNSLAITAGAIDSGTDSVASLAVFIGVLLSTRKTRTFPLGLYKIENLISVVVAIFIFFAGYEVLRHIMQPGGSPDISFPVLLFLALTTVVTFAFGQYALHLGRQTESPTLIAEGRHRQVDVISSVVVLLTAFLGYFELRLEVLGMSLDHIGAGLVVLFIVRTGWSLLSEGMRVLLDASIDFDSLERAKAIIQAEPLVSGINSLVGRNAGRFRFLQADITLRTDNLTKAHQASQEIERKIKSQLSHVERVIVHFQPQSRQWFRAVAPLADRSGTLSNHFGEAPYFALVDINRESMSVEEQRILANPYLEEERGKGIRVAEWLTSHKADKALVREEIKHKGPGYVFANAGISVLVSKEPTLGDALQSVFGIRLEPSSQE